MIDRLLQRVEARNSDPQAITPDRCHETAELARRSGLRPQRWQGRRDGPAATALIVAALALAGCGDDDSGGGTAPAVDPKAAVGPPKECADRLIEVVTADYMRERGVIAEQGQEALFRLAREMEIELVCAGISADAPVGEAAEEVAEVLKSQAD